MGVSMPETQTSEFITYTIVLRKDYDTIGEVLSHSTEGVCFLWTDDGVTQHALDSGADPSSWDESVPSFCEQLYAQGGNTAIYDYINEHHPDMPWLQCEGCETDTPHWDKECLCCGLKHEEDEA